VQVPTAVRVTVNPDTVQTGAVLELSVTTRPEDAVGLTGNGAVPNGWFESIPNVIVWGPCVIVNFWVNVGAAE
jgi:hypothetical protein